MAAKPEEVPTVPADTAPVEKHPETTPPTDQKLEPSSQETSAVPTEALENLKVSETKIEDGIPAAAPTSSTSVPQTAEETPSSDIAKPSEPQAVPEKSTSTAPTWPETPQDHPLTKFFTLVPSLIDEVGAAEVYGVTLSPTEPFHTKLILQKFLRANQGDLEKAKEQLFETLKWRKEFDPRKAVDETFAKDRFDGLGYVVEIEGVPESVSASGRDVVTFNVYGAVKDNKATFGDLEGFLRWRVGLMERSVQKLNLANATQPIPDYGQGPDPYQGFQIHDYLQVSFLRQDPVVKAATKRTIEILGRYYPETLSRKFFVNVPVIMGWLYQATKLVVAKETAKKFTVLSYGSQLAAELGKGVPKVYGGEAGELEVVGEGMRLE